MIRNLSGFDGEVLRQLVVTLRQPFATIFFVITGLATILGWIGVGENWAGVTKFLLVFLILLLILLLYALYVIYYSIYSKIDRPLPVRKVAKGTHYFKDHVMVILERRDTVVVGDILTLFVCEGEAEIPICLLSVEAHTSKHFPQSVVFLPLSDEALLDYLEDENKIEKLQAKQSLRKEYLNV